MIRHEAIIPHVDVNISIFLWCFLRNSIKAPIVYDVLCIFALDDEMNSGTFFLLLMKNEWEKNSFPKFNN